jgi:hypothetical protein
MAQIESAGTVEPWLTIHGQSYTREHAFAIYCKAERGDLLTEQEARVAAAWCVHPLICGSVGVAPYGIAALLLKRQQLGLLWATYRPQHHEGCESRLCGVCGHIVDMHQSSFGFWCMCHGALKHKADPKACTCGLSALLAQLETP